MLNNAKIIKINKNRGWRGLASVELFDDERSLITTYVFSFSQAVWDDLIGHSKVVLTDDKYYYVIHFTGVIRGLLPRTDQQRSVLIKNFIANIDRINAYHKTTWSKDAKTDDWLKITHFEENKNNHTQSDWNCIRTKSNPINIVNRKEDIKWMKRFLKLSSYLNQT